MTRVARTIALVASLLATALRAQDPPRLQTASGAHYDVGSQLGTADAQERLALLESAWPQFARFFGREPKLGNAKLAVRVFANAADMQRGMALAGADPTTESLACYCPTTRTVYLHGDWGAPFVRRRMAEECTQQFLAHLAQHKSKMPAWCARGLCHHLGSLAWDGTQAELGIARPISLEDDAGKALARIQAKDFDYRKLLGAFRLDDAPVHHEVVRLLATEPGYRKKFLALLPRLEKGLDVGEADWATHFGPYAKFADALRASALAAQEPFAPGHLGWDTLRVDRDAATRAPVHWLQVQAGDRVSACHARADAQAVAATVTLPATSRRVGVVLDWVGLDDHRLLLFRADGVWEAQARTKDGWQALGAGRLAAADAKFTSHRLRVERATASDGALLARVLCDDAEIARLPVRNARFGFAADSGVVTFAAVRIAR